MRPGRRAAAIALLAFAAAAAPTEGRAHLVGVAFGDFYAGALHLVGALEHMTVLVALALLAARQPRTRARWMLLALPIGAALGLLAADAADAAAAAATPSLTAALTAGLAVIGLLGAAAIRLPTLVSALIAGEVGVLLGYANGLSGRVEGVADWPLYAAGVLTACTVVSGLAIAVASELGDSRSWAPLAQRAVSSWMAAIGVAGLSLALFA